LAFQLYPQPTDYRCIQGCLPEPALPSSGCFHEL